MSFTDQKQRTATEQDCKAPWGGHKDGKAFRCKLCGHKFVPGDKWRWLFGKGITNFIVCEKCDVGSDDELRAKMKAIIDESKVRFWWLWLDLESWIHEAQNSRDGG